MLQCWRVSADVALRVYRQVLRVFVETDQNSAVDHSITVTCPTLHCTLHEVKKVHKY
jgi:hypothetical protein